MAGTKPRILVVEDDAAIRGLLADRLSQYELVFATCQKECYEELESPDFDLVLLDVRLPRTPDEMMPANEVGIDILDEIRDKRMVKRNSSMQMPVVVMTAHDSDPVPVLVEHGASDYIKKPFGQGQALEDKITRALEGAGALVPAGNIVSATVELAFHPTDRLVRVESFSYGATHHELLSLLGDLYLEDQKAKLRLNAYRGLTGDQLADMLKISDKAVRQRITNFRREVTREFKSSLGRTLDANDIIQNVRKRDGYRLNPFVVRIVGW